MGGGGEGGGGEQEGKGGRGGGEGCCRNLVPTCTDSTWGRCGTLMHSGEGG